MPNVIPAQKSPPEYVSSKTPINLSNEFTNVSIVSKMSFIIGVLVYKPIVTNLIGAKAA